MSVKILNKEDLAQAQILQAAKKLFYTYGLVKLTMDDLAKAIGKTRGSIYYYYKSKDEIVDAVIDMEIQEVRAAMDNAVEGAFSSEEKIKAFFRSKLEISREKYVFFDALESGMDADSVSNFKITQKIHHDRTLAWEGKLLTRIIIEGIAGNELKIIEESTIDNLIFVLLSSLHGLKREMRMENNVRKIESVIGQLTGIILYGLSK